MNAISPILAASPATTQALTSAANWHKAPRAAALIQLIVGAHRLSMSLPSDVRRHIGWLEGSYVKTGLANGNDWKLQHHGAAIGDAWQELAAERELAVEMAMRACGFARYDWSSTPRNIAAYEALDEAAPSLEAVVGDALEFAEGEA